MTVLSPLHAAASPWSVDAGDDAGPETGDCGTGELGDLAAAMMAAFSWLSGGGVGGRSDQAASSHLVRNRCAEDDDDDDDDWTTLDQPTFKIPGYRYSDGRVSTLLR